MKRFSKKESNKKYDFDEMKKFYFMVIKMKKKRPYININRLMKSIYQDFYNSKTFEKI